MTKLTAMNATARRQVARAHRVEVAVIRTELDTLVGFSPRYAVLHVRLNFHLAQAKLWDAAAANAEAKGFVRLA